MTSRAAYLLRLPATAALGMTLAMSGCGDLGPSDPPYLDLSGTVRVDGGPTGGPGIAGARVRVVFSDFIFDLVGNGELLAETATRADGTYAVQVPAPPGYASPNCAVMTVHVSAAGFSDQSVSIEDPDPAPSGTCPSRRGRANVLLYPQT